MYVDSSTIKQNGKKYVRHLLRESFRENGKVKHRTIASLSRCSPDEIEAIRLALRHKKDLSQLTTVTKESVTYLQEHPLAKTQVASRKIGEKCKKLKIATWVKSAIEGRSITVTQDPEVLAEESKLDGCYVLKTDLAPTQATKEIIHDRYKDLALVEWAFRSSKTTQLEMRPIHVRLATRTRGHALVVMMAYRMVQELSKRWSHLNKTVAEGIAELSTLCVTEVKINGGTSYHQIPEPSDSLRELL